eukprot:Tamp_09612.p1 GENE.Tamp_09612~~Tamp_09612.p1  ORF type:complete len:367 (+),score=16.50 Tamp_09612:560-1660(+)
MGLTAQGGMRVTTWIRCFLLSFLGMYCWLLTLFSVKKMQKTKRHCTILVYPKEHIDQFWGKGHTERYITRANSCSSSCRFVSHFNNESIDAVLFLSGHPGNVDGFASSLWEQMKYRPRTTAVMNTEGDNDIVRAMKDRELYDLRISYSFQPDIFHSQVCGGLNELRTEFVQMRLPEQQNARLQRAGLVGLISNCGAPFRNRYIPNLMKQIHVDQFGKCFRNKNQTLNSPRTRAGKISLIQTYRFCLSFENFEADEYITEKIWDCYLAGAVPIYYGSRAIYKYAPRNSFIDVNNFGSEFELVKYLKELGQNESLYKSFYGWGIADLNATISKYACDLHPACQFCDSVRRAEENTLWRIVRDMGMWFQ